MICFALGILFVALDGCKTHSPSPYVSPRVEGRVLDRQTHQPISNVKVRRDESDESDRSLDAPKGGQRMEQAPAVRTGADGRFVLDSVRDLALFGRAGWYSVSLSFEHPGYERFATSYTLRDATNSAAGEPVVRAGEILLVPRSR